MATSFVSSMISGATRKRTKHRRFPNQHLAAVYGLPLDHGQPLPNPVKKGLPTIRELIASQACCLCYEVIAFRDARCPRSRKSVVLDSGVMIAQLFK